MFKERYLDRIRFRDRFTRFGLGSCLSLGLWRGLGVVMLRV